MRIATSLAIATIAIGSVTSSCLDARPAGPVVLCASTADCVGADRCDLAAHVCIPKASAGADVTAPTVTDAHFEPAAVKDGGTVKLVVVADEALAANVVPSLTFANG